MKKTVIAYLHTHWDREWYREYEVFRIRLLRVFDNVLSMLENNKIPSFYFDGQIAALEDYLEIRPEKFDLVKKLISEKRLFIGPFYTLVDEFLTDKNSFEHNLQIGMEYAHKLGCTDFIGYLADTFGHSKQVTKVFKEFGIDKCVVWRGCGDIPAEFKFCGVNTVNLVRGYFMDYFSATFDFFEKIGVKTYIREDNHIFPTSNSAQEVRSALLSQIKHCKLKHENITKIKNLAKGFEVKSEKSTYYFDIVVISIGGKSGYSILKNLNHTYESPCPALVGLSTSPHFKELQGVTIKNCKIKSERNEFVGDILFTDNGITGPAVFNLSSINARKELPYKITVDFLNKEVDWQKLFDTNPKKNLSNVLSEFLPKSFVNTFLEKYGINPEQKCCTIRSNTKVLLDKNLRNFEFSIIATRKDGEIVTCGGINLKEIDPKTFESKIYPNLYFCGEVLNIDGFCGGFNLQNCWTSGFLSANAINNILN